MNIATKDIFRKQFLINIKDCIFCEEQKNSCISFATIIAMILIQLQMWKNSVSQRIYY